MHEVYCFHYYSQKYIIKIKTSTWIKNIKNVKMEGGAVVTRFNLRSAPRRPGFESHPFFLEIAEKSENGEIKRGSEKSRGNQMVIQKTSTTSTGKRKVKKDDVISNQDKVVSQSTSPSLFAI